MFNKEELTLIKEVFDKTERGEKEEKVYKKLNLFIRQAEIQESANKELLEIRKEFEKLNKAN